MSLDDIKDYLSDTTDLTDAQVTELAYDIQHRLDYTPIHSQIDELLRQFAYWEDYDRTLSN